jgi:hypothetical protein
LTLEQALSEFVEVVPLGGVAAARREALLAAVRSAKERNERFFMATAVGLALMFLVALGLIISHAGGVGARAMTSGIFGISAIGMVKTMLGFWREKVATDLLLDLAAADDAILKEVSKAMLLRLRAK